jgi:hypothetical protein
MEINKKNINLSERTENPFLVPEGYFDLLPQRIMNQIGVEKKTKHKLLLIRYLKPAIGIAAGFLIILVLILFPYKVIKPGTSINDPSVPIDEEYFISYSMDDQRIYETLESKNTETPFDNNQLESVLLNSVSEYDLIVLNN